MNKKKIINDPVYGFINIYFDIIFDLIEHPYFQRLRRIRQLGLTNFVYPGANHSRFQHALGSMHLMNQAISIIRNKGFIISEAEAEAVTIAILLHDVGHGPFSHALEHSIIEDLKHEQISLIIMEDLNNCFNGKLDLAIRIFKNEYEKKFLHQLVSSQLDMDRMDYLKRDSFFTGVYEGVIGSDRIIKMLNVHNGDLVIENKGIYSVEKFLIARRLMYWQVYLHKTVLSAEKLLENILIRAKYLADRGVVLFTTPALEYFLYNYKKEKDNFQNDIKTIISFFTQLDDSDILASIKVWSGHSDKILSALCINLINRNLYKVIISNKKIKKERLRNLKQQIQKSYNLNEQEAGYFVFSDFISNSTYDLNDENIKILLNNGQTLDITEASDVLNLSLTSKKIKKYFLCYPKELEKK